MAAPTEKDAETMPTQKTLKHRVRARMAKTGEAYTAARHQILRKTTEPETATAAPVAPEIPTDVLLVADESMIRATSKPHAEWFALLDAWGATDHNHTEIARWLSETHGTPGWWTQNITVAYERARGLRARHQMADGFSVAATRTVDASPGQALEAFTNVTTRERWLPGAPLRQRPTRAALSARFDWSEPASRVVVTIVHKGESRATVSVTHEQLPDAGEGERLKAAWRTWLGELKALLEG